MNQFPYIDDEGNEFMITFDYDPDKFGEDDPSQSPWHYITIHKVVNSDSEEVSVEFDDDTLYDISVYLWKNYKDEF